MEYSVQKFFGRIARGPAGFGGGGGGRIEYVQGDELNFENESGDNSGEDESQDLLDEMNGGEDPELARLMAALSGEDSEDQEISGDSNSLLGMLLGSDEQPDEDLSDDQLKALMTQEQEGLKTFLADGIKNFALPEDLIPEDFNPNDPKQLRTLLNNSSRLAVSQALTLAFRPIQSALQHNSREMNQRMRRASREAVGDNSFNQMLSEAIPAISDPNIGPVVKNLAAKARKRFPKRPQDAILATKKAMATLGLSTTIKKSSAPSADALDLYTGRPTRR